MRNKCWFDYKTVILTGAFSGIGKELALRLIKDHGCSVLGIARNEKKYLEFKKELGDNFEHKLLFYKMDVSKEESWKELKAYLNKSNISPDILINNAGMLPKFKRFLGYTEEEISRTYNTNFFSILYGTKVIMPMVLESRTPAIINIASSSALCALAGTSLYSSSKGAVKSFTDALREDYRKKCYIGLVCPGFTKTNILSSQIKQGDKSQKAIDLVSSDVGKMADKIIEGMWKKKTDMVFGADAVGMFRGNEIFGTGFSLFCSNVMKLSQISLFKEVFSEEDLV